MKRRLRRLARVATRDYLTTSTKNTALVRERRTHSVIWRSSPHHSWLNCFRDQNYKSLFSLLYCCCFESLDVFLGLRTKRVSCLFFADDESWNKITCYCQKPFAGEYCALVNLKSYEFYFSFPALFSFCAVLFVTSTERNF